MLTREENEYLCRVGPGTPMGAMLRRYWAPACLSEELPAPDCAPVALELFGERLVAFRDSSGAVGVLEERCTHRGASLALGRVEDCGIRCLYHGWKFAVDGTIQETPNLPDSKFKERVKAPAYPVREAGGLVWVYLGPPEMQPPFPEYNWMAVADDHRVPIKIVLDCNFVQQIEGVIDSSHVGILHHDEMDAAREGAFEATAQGRDRFPTEDDAPKIEVENTDFGFHYAAIRRSSGGDPNLRYVRVTPFVMPFLTWVPPGSPVSLFVPMNDVETAFYVIAWDPEVPPDRETFIALQGLDLPGVWGEDFRLHLPEQDREAMAAGTSSTGFVGLIVQDSAVQRSMGPIFDRSREHVVPADLAILRMRRLLMDSARRVGEGGDPIGLDRPVDTTKIEAAAVIVPAQTRWQELVPGNVAVERARSGR